ncbi:hypothetical protein [Comamonas terrigena]|uniref:hypothetical protein n=1 Tax=Comamonas terrigena TaxID=32013 RepID=UPI00235605D1|nr:hypothetical protein [Comamonas terrigena]
MAIGFCAGCDPGFWECPSSYHSLGPLDGEGWMHRDLHVRRHGRMSPYSQVVQEMGQKLPQEHIDFYRAIDDLLWSEWDPIGISTMDWPRDEYHAYLPRVFSLAMGTNEPQVIADYLEWAAVERMALDPNRGHSLEIARRVLAKKQKYGL